MTSKQKGSSKTQLTLLSGMGNTWTRFEFKYLKLSLHQICNLIGKLLDERQVIHLSDNW